VYCRFRNFQDPPLRFPFGVITHFGSRVRFRKQKTFIKLAMPCFLTKVIVGPTFFGFFSLLALVVENAGYNPGIEF